MNLKEKTDEELLSNLKSLAVKDKETQFEILRYLREVESRDLHLARGHPSLFAFCTKFLGFSENESLVRIQAMRLLRDHPGLDQKVQTGLLTLSVAAKAQTAFRRQRPKVLPRQFREKVLLRLEGKSAREADRELANFFPEPEKPERERALSGNLTRIEFTASKQLFEKLEKLKQLLAHQNFFGRYDLLFEYLADQALKKLLPENNALLPGTSRATKRGRYIPIKTRQLIWQNFEQGCNYVDPKTGQRCESKHGLEIDHIQDFAKGGNHQPENLQLLCPAHNQFKSREATRPYRKN